jgi:hypothetical protein
MRWGGVLVAAVFVRRQHEILAGPERVAPRRRQSGACVTFSCKHCAATPHNAMLLLFHDGVGTMSTFRRIAGP